MNQREKGEYAARPDQPTPYHKRLSFGHYTRG